MSQFEKRDLKILFVASECVFYIMTFKTENFEALVGRNRKYADKEELMEYFYTVLSEKNDEYYDLINYLSEDVDEAQDNLICGRMNMAHIAKGQFASNILVEIELLDKKSLPPEFFDSDMADAF